MANKCDDEELTTTRDVNDESHWSVDLPDLPLFHIVTLLRSLPDFSSFGHTCTSWRSASSAAERHFLSSQPPWLCTVDCGRFYVPADQRFCVRKEPSCDVTRRKRWPVGFSSGHLILADGASLHRLSLTNPLTGAEVHFFPDTPYAFSRAVLTPDRTLLAFSSTSMQYCRRGDKSWGVYEFPVDGGGGIAPVRNIAALGDKVYAITVDGKLCTIDLDLHPQPKLALVGSAWPLLFGRFQGVWLGACGGQLLAAICTYRLDPPRAIERFEVRRFDFDASKWVKAEDLGGRAVFVDMSWGLLEDEEPARWGGIRDCVYFIDPMRNEVKAFGMRDGVVREVVPAGTKEEGKVRWDLCVWIIPSQCR